MSTSLVFASMLSYLMKPISSCICYFAFCSHIFFLVCYIYFTRICYMLPNILSFQSFLFLLYFFLFLLMTPVEFHRFCFAFYFFILNSVILKQCNNNSNKFTFLVFISGGIYGILVIVFYVLWLFRRKSEKKKSLRLYRGHETGNGTNKQKMQPIFRVVTNFLFFVCLSQSDSKQQVKIPFDSKRMKKTPKKNRSRIFSINPIPLQINLDFQNKKCLFVTGKRV